MKSNLLRSFLLIFLGFTSFIVADVGPILPGQSLWCITKRIGSNIDIIESKVCNLVIDVTEVTAMLCSKLEVLDSVIDLVESKACEIESKVELLEICGPTAINASTTITQSGFYCLDASNNTGTITVQANTDDVVVDLNGHRIQGVVVQEQNDQITFRNGTIVGSMMDGVGVDVQYGSTNIILQDLVVQNAQLGIQFTAVTGGLIENCEMSQNITAVELERSKKIVIDKSTASCNKNAGFCLLSSTTNCLRDCKAISTGEGNTETSNQTIFGFVSTDGTGNIFERCIANGTQGLQVTDSNSLVAGFALRGLEKCSKIIDSESANATTSVDGVTIPYGILLEASIINPLTLTGVPANPIPGDESFSVDWSKDGKLLAAGFGSSDTENVRIYSFDYVDRILTQIATPDLKPAAAVRSVSWSPDGMYLAIGTASATASLRILVYRFEPDNNTLKHVATPDVLAGDTVFSVDWSPDGKYLAVGMGSSDADKILIYSFDAVAETLTQVAVPDIVPSGSVNEINWRPDGRFIGVAASMAPFSSVYSFENNTLTRIATPSMDTGSTVGALRWSPDGKYYAIGARSADNGLRIYQFQNSVITFVSGVPSPAVASDVISVSWSSDGVYIALGSASGMGGGPVLIYRFDRSTGSLTQVSTESFIGSPRTRAVRWNPGGEFIAAGRDADNFLLLFNVLSFPSKNVIKNNTVYCNSGNSCPGGVGISGSSISNLIIGNTAYANPIPQNTTGGGPIVPTNYAFVANIFNELFGIGPSALQNISVGGCEPICTPTDLGLLSKQIRVKSCDIESQVDIIESKIELITESLCDATAISSGPITAEGYYCLSADATGPFAINASNVVLDLNGRKITNGVTISNRDQIKLFNGVIEGTANGNGLLAQNSTNITLENITIKNSLVGANFDEVTGGLITHCSFTQNTTGVELDRSHKILIDKSTASCNTNAGFCLLSSTTNCLRDCKALSSGEGNTQTADTTIFGFVSNNGTGNIFERCIANSTQALSTTDFNSLVAGFALRGSEQCTKIIDSESANATTSVEGVTIPYGILLAATINNPITLTGVPPIPIPDSSVNSADWSPDGKFLAAGISSSDAQRIRIYEFDRINNALTQVATPDVIPGADVNSVDWSPDGTFLAAGISSGDAQRIRIYEFDRVNSTLTQVATPDVIPGSLVNSVAWSPDGTFLAAGITSGDAQRIRIYEFDRINNTLTQVATPDVIPGANVNSVDWSPDGTFLAVGISADLPSIRIYEFDRANSTLTQVATPDVGPATNVNSVDWSPDGKFLATGIESMDTELIRIYQFDRANSTLTQVATPDVIPGADVNSVDWSPDGEFLAAGIKSADTERIRIYQFDRANSTLTQVATPDVIPGSLVNSVDWSPDGEFLAGGIFSSDTDRIKLYNALTFPSKNVIKNNTVYCNSGNSCPGGVGISGSSIKNLIIGNTAYSNPIPQTNIEGGGPIVSSNYQFVTNVFNELFGVGPSALQNISVGGCEPICTPTDIGLLSKQIKYKACQIESQVDVILSIVDISAIDVLATSTLCDATAVTSGPITDEGYYCLNADATGPFAIMASNVVLDLNGRKITNGVTINNQDQVRLFNGVIEGTANGNGLLAQNSTNITLENITIKNSLVGANFDEVTGGLITHCSFTQNTTGVELDRSHKILIDKSTASCNTNAGFCLLSSTTNCLRDCKALSSGEGNTQTADATIFGFVSNNGTGNIFERCIANSTQALSTTDFNSLVAGFALRGSEQCSKIIDSESANATTSVEGVTVPYGILLEASIGSQLTLTGVPPIPLPGDTVRTVQWSQDQKLIAAGGANFLALYSFDYQESIVSLLTTATVLVQINELDWHPSGKFIAAAGTNSTLAVFDFCAQNSSLVFAAAPNISPSGTVTTVSWHRDGIYLAVGHGTTISIYAFNQATHALTQQTTITAPANVFDVHWSPDGKFLAAALQDTTTTQLVIYRSSLPSGGLTQIQTAADRSEDFNGVKWSPDGKYLAVAGGTLPATVFMYRFEESNSTIPLVTSNSNIEASDIDWSSDGRYIVATQRDNFTNDDVIVLFFDRGTGLFGDPIRADEKPPTNTTQAVDWSPDGQFIIVGAGGNQILTYRAFTFPSKNVIKNNTVYCNSGNSCPGGIGIAGSSIKNLIIGNTAYSNPIPQTNIEGGGPIVPTNYAFVTNVFNQLFQNEPFAIQNIAIGGCEPICQPEDVALLAKQICAKIDDLSACGPTTLTSADVLGGTISLTESGNYCLGEAVTSDVSITGTSIALDLNDNCLTGVIDISGDDVSVFNGTVIAPGVGSGTATPTPAAIDILDGANRAKVQKVIVDATAAATVLRDGRDGIRIAGTDSQIHNCTVTPGAALNSTGSLAGNDGGNGIVLRNAATRTIVRDCLVSGGDGGNGGTTSPFGAGGNGGHGIQVTGSSVSQTEIVSCVIGATGIGGEPGAVGGAAGGRGGDGISIDSTARGIAVHNCIIRNAGQAGTSAAEEIVTVIDLPDPMADISVIDTADGKAINDLVTATDDISVIFSNVADSIRNPIVYNLNNRRSTPGTDAANGDGGVLVPNPPDAGGGNVVVNHIVNVYMDVMQS